MHNKQGHSSSLTLRGRSLLFIGQVPERETKLAESKEAPIAGCASLSSAFLPSAAQTTLYIWVLSFFSSDSAYLI